MEMFGFELKATTSYHTPKSKWTPEEDRILLEQIEKTGPSNWNNIALSLPGRNGKQCRERWIGKLSPENTKSSWTTEEDIILLQCQRSMGNKWSKFGSFLPGRSVITIKNRWNYLKRRDIPQQFSMILPNCEQPMSSPETRTLSPPSVEPIAYQKEESFFNTTAADMTYFGDEPFADFSFDCSDLSSEFGLLF